MQNIIEWLQQWYASQCNGDWEHLYGIKIETVDNPGWYVTINLTGTKYQDRSFQSITVDHDETNWYFCLVRDSKFEASCGSSQLTLVLQIFREWVENS